MTKNAIKFTAAIAVLLLAHLHQPSVVRAAVNNELEFAPQTGIVAPSERPFRDEQCLNGRWQFQPVPVPGDFVRSQGQPPTLPAPDAGHWEATPIKIPSPWNVNDWGAGRDVGLGHPHPYATSSVTFPSYPESWEHVQMGWLRRSFEVPAAWSGKRLLLHFAAVAGDCQILINGKVVGKHFDSYTPFEFDVTPFVHAGGAANELLVGVRARGLFSKTDPAYPKFRNPFPNGSDTEKLIGIWQDVSLVAVSPIYVSGTFVKPMVARDLLKIDVTVTNTGAEAQVVSVGGTIAPWVNLAGKSIVDAPMPRGELGAPVLKLDSELLQIPANGSATITLEAQVLDKLKLWSPDAPNLNGLVITVAKKTKPLDRHYTRFGWREVTIVGRDLRLNGNKIQLFGDLVHPFGTFTMSRRYAWAWYRMVKDFHGNAVRLHAQPMPTFYLDLADEMGLMVLDETAIFGSSINLNFADPDAWTRFADHYDALVLRDRNHPCVFGWSFGNELFAIFSYNNVPQPQADAWYAKLTTLGERERALDPTREWISCDGDEDLKGTLPVWSRHFGLGLPLNQIPDIDKPRMVGESGGTYYAKPPLLVQFNGDRAYESYAGRNEALAIDAYQNVAKLARPELAFFSASETVWFGLEHLSYGYSDFSRLPTDQDGISFTRPYIEGKPGWQPERLSPYVATLNPGWDPALPLYKPLAMFDAMKAALAPTGPAPSPWDHKASPTVHPTPAPPTIGSVAFAGPADSPLYRQVRRWGTPLAAGEPAGTAGMLVVDGARLTPADVPATKRAMDGVLGRGGIVLVSLAGIRTQLPLDAVNALLPSPIALTERDATMLARKTAAPWTAPLGMPDLYFAEDPSDKHILRRGMTGPFVAQGTTLLEAANIDWTLFDAAENIKCGDLVLYEHLQKPAGAAFVVVKQGTGRIAVTTIESEADSPAYTALWRKLLLGMGIKMGAPRADDAIVPTEKPGEHNLLLDGPPAAGKTPH